MMMMMKIMMAVVVVVVIVGILTIPAAVTRANTIGVADNY